MKRKGISIKQLSTQKLCTCSEERVIRAVKNLGNMLLAKSKDYNK